jgi:AraC-like DNA-binding protein
MIIYIKYMVSLRCKMLVESVLNELELPHNIVELGTVELLADLTTEKREQLEKELLKSGLVLMEDKKAVLIEKIKHIIIEMVHYSEELPRINFSNFLSQKLGYDYTYLANIFSEVKGVTIEHYLIANKIERVKELLLYNELNLTEISYLMNHSSVAHLSAQFKNVTGLTPTYFKQLKAKRRKNLEDL